MQASLPEDLLVAFSEFVESRIGLHMPHNRIADIEHGLRAASTEMGWTNVEAFARHLLDAPLCQELVDLLAAHLTIGETYFYRDPRAFEVLENEVLPQLIRAREGKEKRLRIWSAACCTGEEPYSIAMAVRRVLGDRSDWDVSILATDLNPRFLRKAAAGIYTQWSFRTLPEEMRSEFFHRRPDDRWEINDRIKRAVTFAGLNFIEDVFPSPTNGTHEIDVIFCRNVLMYFSRDTAEKVITKVRNSLVEGGWLFTSATDAPRDLFTGLSPHEAEGTVIYRKCVKGAQVEAAKPFIFEPVTPEPIPVVPWVHEPVVETQKLEIVRPAQAAETPAAATPDHLNEARRLADQGSFEESLSAVDLALECDKLDAAAHYLRGVILHELGKGGEAAVSLHRALYLDPGFVVAHVALGSLMRRSGKEREAKRCFSNACAILSRQDRDAVLPDFDGVTAGRLLHMLSTPEEAAA